MKTDFYMIVIPSFTRVSSAFRNMEYSLFGDSDRESYLGGGNISWMNTKHDITLLCTTLFHLISKYFAFTRFYLTTNGLAIPSESERDIAPLVP